MLVDVLELMSDLAEACGPCSGAEPGGPTWPGAGGAGGGGYPFDDSPPAERDRDNQWNRDNDKQRDHERVDQQRERPDHERPDHEKKLQRKNAGDAIVDLVWEFTTAPGGNVGTLAGPLITVASGSEVLGDGVAEVLEADRRREQRIADHTGDHFNTRAGKESGGSPEPDSRAPRKQPPRERSEYVERVMEDIEIKRQFEDFRREARNNPLVEEWRNWK